MSAAAPPTVPPRPVKVEAAAQGVTKLPEIPPRPISKRIERSISPANYPQSPLNEPPILTKVRSRDPIPRPPSVHHLPTPGEEGMEYANIQYESTEPSSALTQDAAAQTRRVAEDLHLHAPKPSLPATSATAKVQPVTRTDITQIGGQALGRTSHDDLSRTRSRNSISRPDSAVRPDSAASGERRRSMVYGDEGGPAELGMRVPINPLLGDVQAPTPAGLSPQATGESPRRHSRRRSGIDSYRPPDSYGLHGHGIVPADKFEREWYAKHPEQLEHEEGHGHGVYENIGSGRGSYALSSEQLNHIVRQTASRGSGFGTSGAVKSYPDEQIGYMASEEYQRSQQNTPAPDSANPLSRVQTHEPPVESPLRRTSFPAEDATSAEVRRSRQSLHTSDPAVSDSDIHVDGPLRRYNKLTGGQETMNESQETKPYVSVSDDGHDGRIPILAEDEIAKDEGGEFMQPAVSPKFERRGSAQPDDHAGSGTITPHSRPASRPGSIYNLHSASHSLSRFLSHQDERDHMHTPLEDVDEYEPLFPDDDSRKQDHADRFKSRPDSLKRRFPSQDIWEDTPSSAMYVAEVSTPDLPDQIKSTEQATTNSTFESPEQEHARKEEVSEEEKQKLIPKDERLAKSKFVPHLRDDMPTRPGMIGRFPSQDVWEDTPDSNLLTTTVGSPQMEEEKHLSPTDAKKPDIPARPAKSRLGEGASSAQVAPSVQPSVPARPPKRQHAVPPADAKLTDPQTLSREMSPVEKKPSLPERPKPQVPARPTRKPGDDGLSKVTSAGSTGSNETEKAALQPKAKPPVPARVGGNIAALKGNFMSDLNKKLGLGPPKEKEPEPEPAEAKPLEDARKGRARGPQRRAPAKSPSAPPPSAAPTHKFTMLVPKSLWSIDEEGSLSVSREKRAEAKSNPEVIDHTDLAKETTSSRAPSIIAPQTAHPSDRAEPVSTSTTAELEADDNPEGELTRKTTASSYSGETVDREESRSQTHVLPASSISTATDSDDHDADEKLEREPTKDLSEPPGAFPEDEEIAEEEPPKIRSEQVSAPAPESSMPLSGKHDSIAEWAHMAVPGETEGSKGSDKAAEPMNEDDVNYKKLEEMTAKADGKAHSDADPQASFSSQKIMD